MLQLWLHGQPTAPLLFQGVSPFVSIVCVVLYCAEVKQYQHASTCTANAPCNLQASSRTSTLTRNQVWACYIPDSMHARRAGVGVHCAVAYRLAQADLACLIVMAQVSSWVVHCHLHHQHLKSGASCSARAPHLRMGMILLWKPHPQCFSDLQRAWRAVHWVSEAVEHSWAHCWSHRFGNISL